MNNPLRFALIGCGQVAESLHLPAAALLKDTLEIQVLVEPDSKRAAALARQFGIVKTGPTLEPFRDQIDAAIVATPNHYHCSLACSLLDLRLPILLEKPIGRNGQECSEILEASKRAKVPVAVGMLRRHTDMCAWIQAFLDAKVLGRLTRVTVEEGQVFDWPVRSAAQLTPTVSGGGVLLDIGVHLLDLLLSWLGPASVEHYFDDAAEGIEAECRVELKFQEGFPAEISLSRLRRLSDSVTFEGRGGVLRCTTMPIGEVVFTPAGTSTAALRAEFKQTFQNAVERELLDFAQAIRGGGVPRATLSQSHAVGQIIDECYASRQPLGRDWLP